MRPWWHPLNLLISHCLASYATLVLLICASALESGPPDRDNLCMIVIAPLAVPSLCIAYARDLYSGLLGHDGFQILLFMVWLYTTAFALRSFLVARRYARHVRVAQGLCRTCGYNLTANTSGVCPECGTPIPNTAGEAGMSGPL